MSLNLVLSHFICVNGVTTSCCSDFILHYIMLPCFVLSYNMMLSLSYNIMLSCFFLVTAWCLAYCCAKLHSPCWPSNISLGKIFFIGFSKLFSFLSCHMSCNFIPKFIAFNFLTINCRGRVCKSGGSLFQIPSKLYLIITLRMKVGFYLILNLLLFISCRLD